LRRLAARLRHLAATLARMNASNAAAPEKFRVALIFDLMRATWLEWQEDKAPRLGAAFAFYTIFSIAPLLIIAIAIAAAVLGQKAAQGQIQQQIQGAIGPAAAKTVQDMIEATAKARGTGLRASILGILISLWGASNLFGQLQDSLNTIWEVTPKPSGGLWIVVRQRFLAFVMVLGMGLLLLATLLASAVVGSFGAYVSEHLGIPMVSLQVLNFVIALLSTTLFFACLFKVLPDAQVQWRDVGVGSILTAILFGVGRLGLGLYLGRSGVSSAYGAAGSLIVVLLWIYYAAQILFFGAEFTQVFANRFGSRVRPSSHAMPVTEAMREQEGLTRLGDLKATEIALDALRSGQPIKSRAVPVAASASGKQGKPAPQVLAGDTKPGDTKPGGAAHTPAKPRIEKADRDYLLGAALGFAAIVLLATRRDKSG